MTWTILTLVLCLMLALGVLAVVALSSRGVSARHARWEEVATTATRHLEGRATPPRLIQNLDRLAQR